MYVTEEIVEFDNGKVNQQVRAEEYIQTCKEALEG
jgi:hypothetical protein